jgi:hypothetical protein
MTHIIKLQRWNYDCGDGCCTDYGTSLTINGEIIHDHFYYHEDLLIHFLKALAIEDYEIILEEDAE